MKRILLTLGLAAVALVAQAQNTQEAAAEAAAALSAADDKPEVVEKPRYWTNSINTNINFGQTYLSQWAAGGYNNVSLAANVDARAHFEKGKTQGTTRLQLDYGFLWSADKPILQTNKDRIYFESKWGYQTPVKNLSYSASIDFKNQFGNNYNYKTPATTTDAEGNVIEPTRKDWRNARVLKSGHLSPAYLNLGIGALWTPAPWFSLNLAPLSGGGVVVTIPELRKTYGMDLKNPDLDPTVGENYNSFRFEFGTQLKIDMAWVINDNFSYSTQFTAFYNYLTPKMEPRMTWDNKVFWKLRKFFALTLSTNLIYDPRVTLTKEDGRQGKGVQFKEFLEFGFTYSISKKM